MGFLARAVAETKAGDPLSIWAEMLRAGVTAKTGKEVNLESAFRVSAFFACVAVLSRGVAQVPFKLMQTVLQDNLEKIFPARAHPLYDLMASAPNDWTTSFEFRETLVLHAALGNAYAFKNKGVLTGGLKELILLNPGKVKPEQQPDFSIVYKVTGADGKTVPLPADMIWHVRGPSWDGFSGMEMLSIAREALGLSMALDDSVAGLHKDGVRPSGVYSVDGSLNAQQHEQLTKWLKEQAAAPGTPLILDRGAKWLSQVMTSVDAQHYEMRNYQLAEVCRFLGVSPHKVFATDKTSTYASAEQFNIQHVVDALGPWYARIEQSADLHLLTKKERQQGYYFKFNAAGLLRGAMADQAEFFAKMLGAGGTRQILTQDEIRGLLEFNPMGGDAAVLHAPTGSNPDPAAAT